MMTVKELKAHLEQFDESMEIILECPASPWKPLMKVDKGVITNVGTGTRPIVKLK